ncbi:MAG: hypothetical protein AAGJ35_16095, partial [Myxococcota bacterium]
RIFGKKRTFLKDVVGIDTMAALYRTDTQMFDCLSNVAIENSTLSQTDIQRMRWVQRWARAFTHSGMPARPPEDFCRYKSIYTTSDLDMFVLDQIQDEHRQNSLSGRTETNHEPPSVSGSDNIALQMAKLVEIQHKGRENAKRKATKDSDERSARELRAAFDKPNVSAYPSIPGKKWLNTKKSFLAIAASQGLAHTLDPDFTPGVGNSISIAKHEADCSFMQAVLEHVTARGETSWVATRDPDASPHDIWKRIIKWEEKSGQQEQRAINANKFLSTEKFTSNYCGGFKTYINKFFECLRELEELGQPVAQSMATTYLLNNMTATKL